MGLQMRAAAAWNLPGSELRTERPLRAVQKGVNPVWLRGEAPPPMYCPAHTRAGDRVALRAGMEKGWSQGIYAAAPLQDARGLMDQYGCVISAAFLNRQRGKPPRVCANYKPTVNRFCQTKKFKSENLEDVPNWGEPQMHMWSRDVKNAFGHLLLRPWFQLFMIIDTGPHPNTVGPHRPRFVVPLSMNFGWCNAPELWDMVCCEMKYECRRNVAPHDVLPYPGRVQHAPIKNSIYVDDQIGGSANRELAQQQADSMDQIWLYFGMTKAQGKGQDQVGQWCVHLGLELLTKNPAGLYIVPAEKERMCTNMAKYILCRAARRGRWISARRVGSYVGFLGSLKTAERQAQFRSRSLLRCLARHGVYKGRGNWGIDVKLDKRSWAELEWGTNLQLNRSRRTMWYPSIDRVAATDASKSTRRGGWGYLTLPEGLSDLPEGEKELVWAGQGKYAPMKWPNTRIAFGIWSRAELQLMIATLEIRGLRRGIESDPELHDCTLLSWQDNTVCIGAWKRLYSKSSEIQDEITLLSALTAHRNMTLILRYINTSINPSDYWSRVLHRSDWTLSLRVLAYIFEHFGIPTVDRFAQPHQHVVGRYNCPYAHPDAEGRDAFTQNWGGELNWINPPWGLIAKVLQKLRAEPTASAILILPVWEALWAPLLRDLAVRRLPLQLSPEDVIPGKIARLVPEPLGNSSWRLAAFYVPRRDRGRQSLKTITEELELPSSSELRAACSQGSARQDSVKFLVPPPSTARSGPSSCNPPPTVTTRVCGTGWSTTASPGTTRGKSPTPRSVRSPAGCSARPLTRTLTSGRRPATTTLTACLALGLLTRTTSPSSSCGFEMLKYGGSKLPPPQSEMIQTWSATTETTSGPLYLLPASSCCSERSRCPSASNCTRRCCSWSAFYSSCGPTLCTGSLWTTVCSCYGTAATCSSSPTCNTSNDTRSISRTPSVWKCRCRRPGRSRSSLSLWSVLPTRIDTGIWRCTAQQRSNLALQSCQDGCATPALVIDSGWRSTRRSRPTAVGSREQRCWPWCAEIWSSSGSVDFGGHLRWLNVTPARATRYPRTSPNYSHGLRGLTDHTRADRLHRTRRGAQVLAARSQQRAGSTSLCLACARPSLAPAEAATSSSSSNFSGDSSDAIRSFQRKPQLPHFLRTFERLVVHKHARRLSPRTLTTRPASRVFRRISARPACAPAHRAANVPPLVRARPPPGTVHPTVYFGYF